MLLTQAIAVVVKDTRETTDPSMTIPEAIAVARQMTDEEFAAWLDEGIVDGNTYAAYCAVADATEEEIKRATSL